MAAGGGEPPEQPTKLFDAVERESTLAQRVGGELEKVIVQSRFLPGERLPSERDLAERFGVSRTVVREAVRGLAAKGLLEVRAGSGTIVRAPSAKLVVDSMSRLLSMSGGEPAHRKVVEVRRVLEVEIAGLAARRRTGEDIERIQQILNTAEEQLDDPETFVETDVAFHATLARATHNELFPILLDSIANVMVQVRLLGLQVSGTPRRALDHHRRIFRSVKAGDVAGARRAMDAHMDEAASTMHQALDEDEGDG